jgi:hypothetical protein
MTTPLKPRGPFSGPPQASRVTMPVGDTILTLTRPYEPSWHHLARVRTTWTDRLGGHYGPVGPFLATKGRA